MKHTIFYRILEEFNEFVLAKNQMHAVVLAIFVLTKSEGFP